MWPRRYHILDFLTESYSFPKGRKILWNDSLEEFFKKLNHMVSVDTLLSYPYWKIPFNLHTYDSDKPLGSIISHINKHIAFLLSRLINTQRSCTMTKKELLDIVE